MAFSRKRIKTYRQSTVPDGTENRFFKTIYKLHGVSCAFLSAVLCEPAVLANTVPCDNCHMIPNKNNLDFKPHNRKVKTRFKLAQQDWPSIKK